MKLEQTQKRIKRLEKWQKETIEKINGFQKNIDKNNDLMANISKRIKTFNLRVTNIKKELDKFCEETNILFVKNTKSIMKALMKIEELLDNIEILQTVTKDQDKQIQEIQESIKPSLIKRTLILIKKTRHKCKTNTPVR